MPLSFLPKITLRGSFYGTDLYDGVTVACFTGDWRQILIVTTNQSKRQRAP